MVLNQDIEELLVHTKDVICSVLSTAKRGTISKVQVKNVMENLRSVLDYSAQDIAKKLKENPKNGSLDDKVYFPYGQRKNHFDNSVKRNLRPLKTDLPILFDVLEAVQPYKSSDSWLVDLCILTNEAKHNNLTKTENQKTVSIRQGNAINISGASNVVMHNNYYNGQRLDDVYVKEGTVNVVKHAGGTEIIENNRIKFHGKEVEVAPFLEHCHNQLSALMTDIYAVLHSKA
jgi:hypothetical protein